MEGVQRLLLEELHHRIKNVLATVMAIASQSLRNADSVEHGHEAIEHRLLALGRVHDLLLKTNWTSATLASIVQTAIEPFDKGERFSVEIPDIDVSPAAVLPLAMILNELCTNAVKYGAFSNASGCVAISAAVDASEERFSFTWVETGGPSVQTPTHTSFGTRLIEQGLRRCHQSDAEVRLAIRSGRAMDRRDARTSIFRIFQQLSDRCEGWHHHGCRGVARHPPGGGRRVEDDD